MKRYKIETRQWSTRVALEWTLSGAAMAMQAASAGYRLTLAQYTLDGVRFSTNCENFVSAFKLEVSNYGVACVEEIGEGLQS